MSMSHPIFTIKNPSQSSQEASYFGVGIPCGKGQWAATDTFLAITNNTVLENAYVDIKQLWDDGSVKWLFVSGILPQHALNKIDITIEVAPPSDHITASLPVKKYKHTLSITLKNGDSITLNTSELCSFELAGKVVTGLQLGNAEPTQYDHCHTRYQVIRHGNAYSAVVVSQAACLLVGEKKLDVMAESTIFLHDGTISTQISFINPAAALHPQGQWDLGDPNTLYIDELSLAVEGNVTHYAIDNATSDIQPLAENEKITIYQASSGHENWDSPVHVDASNKVTLPFSGYKITSNQTTPKQGQHSNPSVWIGENPHTYTVNVETFWQHFPSSAKINANTAIISLFGAHQAAHQALQPGEQTTRTFLLSPSRLYRAKVEISPAWLMASKALPYAPFQANSEFSALINEGIIGENSFFEKRIKIDEFGWRHFGELYADHETSLSPDETYFISHYNNQYDPIQGMLNRWLISGDHRWFELADDLAKHVADIDVYHTSLDKPEYSGGMFWHTDHYVQAYTATHRTYSKHQPSNVYDEHAGGGGPGGQHCYTNGLLMHYQLTGSQASKRALLSICHWVSQYYEGDGTIISALLSLKNAGTPGLKNNKTGKYPLDRGTGNYLQALMDRYELLGRFSDLAQCAFIIRHTISPSDNLALRELKNIEATWFYTVFLQAVCRFIHVKECRQENDNDYCYAVSAMIHYAKWMVSNEYAYLDQPELLEFPNQTWTGQDLRKLCILEFAAAYLNDEWAIKAKTKSLKLKNTIIARLKDNSEATTTRVLCLLMQNANFVDYAVMPSPMKITPDCAVFAENKYSLGQFIWKIVRGFSFKRERTQLTKRFPQLQQWLGKP